MNAETTAATHTPGPWNVERPYQEEGVYISGPNTGLIAKLFPPDKGMFNVDKRVSIDGNARLIAQAPNLLEALQELLQFVPVQYLGTGPFYRRSECAQNRAIDKALTAIAAASQP